MNILIKIKESEVSILKSDGSEKEKEISVLRIQIENLKIKVETNKINENTSRKNEENWSQTQKKLEEEISKEKRENQILSEKFRNEKKALKEKLNQKMRELNEELENKTVEMLVDYKKECNSLKQENKQLFEENSELKCELNYIQTSVDSSKRSSFENGIMLEKLLKTERKKHADEKSELENQMSIWLAEKAELMNDLDTFQKNVDQLKEKNLLLLRENKLLLTKIVNCSEYPALRKSDHKSINWNESGFRKREQFEDLRNSGLKLRESRSQGNLSLEASGFFEKNISLTPSFLEEKKAKPVKISEGKNTREIHKKFQGKEVKTSQKVEFFEKQPAAVSLIRELKMKNKMIFDESELLRDQLSDFKETIKDMSSKMQEMADKVSRLSDENISIETEKRFLESKLKMTQKTKAEQIREQEDQNMRILVLEKTKSALEFRLGEASQVG